ncbi:phage tail tape measure protein [Methylobacterium indicum]|nr:phage tail tape measure protein [Methylobacterium indicum]
MAADIRGAIAMETGLGKAAERRSELQLKASNLAIRAKEAENRVALKTKEIEANLEIERGRAHRAQGRRYDSAESQARRAASAEKKRQDDLNRQRIRAQRDAERERNYTARHGAGFNNAYGNSRRFMNRQTGLLAYRSSLEEARGAEGIQAMRNATAAALRRYRTEMQGIRTNQRLTGIVDQEAQDRALKRFQTEQKNARANYGVRMSLARAEQQQLDRAERGRIKQERERLRERRAAFNQAYSGVTTVGAGASRMRNAMLVPAAIAAGGIAATGAAVRTGIGARMSTDTAETNLRMFGGEGTTMMSQAKVKEIREGWLDKEALRNGMSVPSAMNAYTEVLKAGIPKEQAGDVTKKILEATAGMDLNVPETTKLVGRLAQLTKQGPDGIGDMLNSMGIVAAETAADSNELVSSLRRGAGALSNKNFKVSDLTAFTGVGISAGIQEGMAGTFIEHQQRDLLNAKYARGQEAKDLNKAFGMLGMGSRGAVSAATAKDPAGTLEKLYTKLGEIAEKDPVKANLIASLIGKDEWGGKMLMMAQSRDKIRSTRQAANDPNNKGFLATLKGEKLGSWAGMWNTTKATFQLFWEKFGMGFDGILREVTTYFAELGQNFDWNKVTLHVQAFMDGLKEGFGVRTWRELIDNIVGTGGSRDFIAQVKSFGRGVAEGITWFVNLVKKILGYFGINGQTDAQTMGSFASKLLLVSASLIAIAPFLSVFSGLAGGIMLLYGALKIGAGVYTAARTFLGKTPGELKNSTVTEVSPGEFKPAEAAKPGGPGVRLSEAPSAAEATKGGNGLTSLWLLYEWMKSNATGNKAAEDKILSRPDVWQRSPSGAATVQRQSFSNEAPTLRSLVQKASVSSSREHEEPTLRSMIQTAALSNMSERMGGLVQYASLGGNLGSALGSFSNNAGGSGTGGGGSFGGGGSGPLLGNQTPGTALGNVGIGRRGIIGGGGGGNGAPFSVPDSVPMTPAERNTLGLILKYEGGYKNQMNYVGKSQGLDPATPKGYTAQGYYQMLNSNWRRIAPKLGINTPNAMASSLEDQTKVALHLLRNGGVGNWANFNPRLKAAIARGEVAPTGMVPNLGGGGDGGGSGSGVGQYAGLRVKGAQATGGGGAHVGTTDLARAIQGDLPGGVKHFAAFNDHYHKGTSSKHASGLAFDTSLKDPSQSVAAANAIREKLKAAGLQANDFKVIDEYLNPSSRATGGHIHTQFNSAEAAAKYRQYAESMKKSTAVASKAAVDPDRFKTIAAPGDSISGGWKPGAGGNAKAIEGASRAPLPSARMNPDEATRNVPLEPSRTDPAMGRRAEAGGGGGGGGGGSPQIIIQGHNGDPEALANAVQRRLSERMARRTTEVEHNWG